MGSGFSTGQTIDQTDMLNEALEHAWSVLCAFYDVNASVPDMLTLLDGVDLALPERAAEIALTNMLLEITEKVSRFSVWYRQPTRAYGLISVRDGVTQCIRWLLAPEAVKQWAHVLQPLAWAIWKNTGLIQAILLVESLMQEIPSNDPCIDASCQCDPPRTIRVKQSVLSRAEILCDQCLYPFTG